jgi:toxin FitB
MKYLLDTNVISERYKPGPEKRCLEWLALHQHECAVSTVTLAELSYGVERLPNGKRKRALAKKLDFLRQDYRESIVGFNEEAASEWGRHVASLELTHGTGILEQLDYPDTQIAAIALAQQLIVVTSNQKDFPGLETLNPSLPN